MGQSAEVPADSGRSARLLTLTRALLLPRTSDLMEALRRLLPIMVLGARLTICLTSNAELRDHIERLGADPKAATPHVFAAYTAVRSPSGLKSSATWA
jgi:hypothetical protein